MSFAAKFSLILEKNNNLIFKIIHQLFFFKASPTMHSLEKSESERERY